MKKVNYTQRPIIINGVRVYADSYYGLDKTGAVWQTDGYYRNGVMPVYYHWRNAVIELGEYNKLTELIARRRAKHSATKRDVAAISLSYVRPPKGHKLYC
jgi:hypothetical protein